MKITFVKKILADGSPCPKCQDVQDKLEKSGQIARIEETIIADERDPNSAGMLLAAQFEVNRAPFFIVEEEHKDTRVYTVYLKFVKEVLEQETEEAEELSEIMSNEDLDFL